VGGCSNHAPQRAAPAGKDSTNVTTSGITDVLARHTPRLMAIPGVVGTAQGEQGGRPCIVVYVKEETDSLVIAIPSSLEGFPVRIQATGEIKPQH
jgi:hypothetical protein